jgi:DNA-binding NarL/FixJ family response regulator
MITEAIAPANHPVTHPGSAPSGTHFRPSLSPRETDVLHFLALGLSNREISNLLFVSQGTVKIHVEHILAKLGMGSRVQLAVWAMRNGFAPE